MAQPPLIEVRVPGTPVRRIPVDRALEVGRQCEGIVVDDDGVSRRHLKLLPSPLGLSVADLGSRNGTLVNGRVITGRTTLQSGDVVRLGGTDIVVLRHAGVPQVPPPAVQPSPESLDPRTFPAPPPAPSVPAAPGRLAPALRWVFQGGETPAGMPTFRSYLELPRRLPQPFWHAIRAGSVLLYLALCIALFVRPAGGLFTFFKIIVPLLPILFFIAPGLWRNICPLAAANQAARVFGFGRAGTAPKFLRERGYLVAITLFFGIAGARLALFNASGPATGILLSITILNAFLAGVAFKGKSGWCSSICPLLPLQRLYGQTPFVKVANTHCNPCVACTRNCYDFKPQPAYQADLHDPDPLWANPRRVFAGALPGFVLGFFTLLNHQGLTNARLYERLALFVLVSVGIFFVADAVLPVARSLVTAFFGAAALNIFYFFGADVLAGSLHTVFGGNFGAIRWPLRIAVAVLTVIWISRTYWVERRFTADAAATAPAGGPVALTLLPARKSKPDQGGLQAAVRFLPGDTEIAGQVGVSILEIAEKDGQQIEAGCRMGVCGADPVAIAAGASCLSEPDEEERNTLRRLGFADNTRMACCARLTGEAGSVQVKLKPDPGAGPGSGSRPVDFDRSVTSVVVIGSGIAGVTAADFVRRGHPDCEIHVVGSESHGLYNRMGISRLVYGRSAMTGLYLLDEQWYADNQITTWLNTIADWIDPVGRRVGLATADVLPYDRLILATGSSSSTPDIPGIGAPGTFVLRSAGDAMDLRAYAQRHRARRAVVAGGGLLGLEAAYSLRELGLSVTVLERGARLMSKQIDARCSEMVHAHFQRVGIEVAYRAESASLQVEDRVRGVVLKDGRELPADIYLAAVGIKPNTGLAKAAGLAVNRGVLVDDRMQTSAPGVFAAGDVAEHGALVLGLWPVAAKQGEVAAVNALGGDARLTAEVPATILKGVGLELSSIGRVEPEAGDEVIVSEDARLPSYRRLIVSRGVVVGAIVLGHHPEDLAAATAAVKKHLLVDAWSSAALRRGDWAVLASAGRVLAGSSR